MEAALRPSAGLEQRELIAALVLLYVPVDLLHGELCGEHLRRVQADVRTAQRRLRTNDWHWPGTGRIACYISHRVVRSFLYLLYGGLLDDLL